MNRLPISRLFCWGMIAVLLTSCQRLPTEYGRSDGDSINGVKVLYDYLKSQGHDVTRLRQLDDQINAYDTLIWFDKQHGDWQGHWEIEKWLAYGDRTLLYIGRDFDAELSLWADMHQRALAEGDRDSAARAQDAMYRAYRRVSREPMATFPMRGTRHLRTAALGAEVDANSPLMANVDDLDTLYLRASPEAQEGDVPQLIVGDVPFVLAAQSGESAGILVANGAFLLNYALLDPAHRRLAEELMAQLGTNRRIAFVEGGSPGSGFEFNMDKLTLHNPFHFLTHPSARWLLAHWVVFALLLLAYKWPIFGRPQAAHPTADQEFASHIRAFGGLLQLSGDRAYAEKQLAEFQTTFGGQRQSPPSRTTTEQG